MRDTAVVGSAGGTFPKWVKKWLQDAPKAEK
jgi:hypothetical protein